MDAADIDILHIAATELAPFLGLWIAADRLFFQKMRNATNEILDRLKVLEDRAAKRDTEHALMMQRMEFLESRKNNKNQ